MWIKTDNDELLNLDCIELFYKSEYESYDTYTLSYVYKYNKRGTFGKYKTKESCDKRFNEIEAMLMGNADKTKYSRKENYTEIAHGQTLEGEYGEYGELIYRCSNCEYETLDIYKYCPECGAKMKY